MDIQPTYNGLFGKHGDKDAAKVVLTALVKGNAIAKNRVLKELTPEDLLSWDWLFEFMVESIQSKGYVDIEKVQQKTRDMVRNDLPFYMTVIDKALASEAPDTVTLDAAIDLLLSDEPRTVDEQENAETTILAALFNGSNDLRSRVLAENYSDCFEHYGRTRIYEWAVELYKSWGKIPKEKLIKRVEEYVDVDVLRTFTARIDAVFATEAPDPETVEAAIDWLKGRDARVKDLRTRAGIS